MRLSIGLLTLFASSACLAIPTEQFPFITPSSHGPFDVVTLQEYPDHQLRVKTTNASLCDSNVVQYTGYLDISADKHLFFWFFESRNSPSEDPLTLWLNGGPGCSSTTGLLFELGPCNVVDEGRSTQLNNASWTTRSNVIFLDQPVGVGYSWASKGGINNTPDAAKDVYIFLQLFYSKFRKYSKLPFHLAGESYGGMYLPNMASVIHHENKQLKSATTRCHIPLTSVLIGNGLTDPYIQITSLADYGCAPSKYAIFDDKTCSSMRSKASICQRLISSCYKNPGRFTCVPANVYCETNIEGPLGHLSVNPYDTRMPCDQKSNPLCFKEFNWIDTFMNRPDVKAQLGAAPQIKFESCSNKVGTAFTLTGDAMHNAAALLPELLQDGIRVLVYAGEWDAVCNWIGNKRWFLALDSPFKGELAQAQDRPFLLDDGNLVGELLQAGTGAGSFTFLKLDGGHMVPHDSPQAALKMFTRWVANEPLDG